MQESFLCLSDLLDQDLSSYEYFHALPVEIQKKNNKCGIGNRGKTKIVVKEHFSEKGKTMEELLTDVM